MPSSNSVLLTQVPLKLRAAMVFRLIVCKCSHLLPAATLHSSALGALQTDAAETSPSQGGTVWKPGLTRLCSHRAAGFHFKSYRTIYTVVTLRAVISRESRHPCDEHSFLCVLFWFGFWFLINFGENLLIKMFASNFEKVDSNLQHTGRWSIKGS